MTGKATSTICNFALYSLLLLATALPAMAGSVPKHKHHDDHKTRAAAQLHSPDDSLGFSMDKIDTFIDPRQDFYGFAGGQWLNRTEIPDTEAVVGQMNGLANEITTQILNLLETSAATSSKAKKGSVEQQVGDMYASAMNTKLLNKLGYEPLKPGLARIDALASLDELSVLLAHQMLTAASPVFLVAAVGVDARKSDEYAMKVAPGSLGLGGTDSYLDEKNEAKRAAYVTYITQLLQLTGLSADKAKAQANTVLAMETTLAGAKMTPLEARDPAATYNKMALSELQKKIVGFNLNAFLSELDIAPPETVIVTDTGYMDGLGRLLAESSLDDIKTYLRFRLVNASTGQLSQDFMDLDLEFYQKYLHGLKQLRPRNEYTAQVLQSGFGHPVARLYVKEYLSPESKKQVEEMVVHIREEFTERLKENQWLDDKTRTFALEKLAAMKISVGYPDKWIDFSSVDIIRNDYFGNMERLNSFSYKRNLAKLGQAVVADGFSISGSTLPTNVNAAYQATYNSIEISAAILQPPFFFPDLDPAVNYGAIGAVIGHEITHGFDSSGRQFDARGNLRNWWTEKDGKEFVKRAEVLVKQFDSYEALPGLHVNGKLCVTENIADLGGVNLAYAALQRSMAGKTPVAKINGYTQEQRFFLSWAHLWLQKIRPEILPGLINNESHPPSQFRVIGPLVHLDGFYEAFGIQEKDPMWHPVTERVTIW